MTDKNVASDIGIEDVGFFQQLKNKITEWAQTDDGKNNKWADIIMLVPNFFKLICRLAIDPDVSAADKAILAGVIVYFISPIDIMPEGVLGPVGFLDDIALVAFALTAMIKNTNPRIVQKHWDGTDDILNVIKSIVEVADIMLGDNVFNKVKGVLAKIRGTAN